MPDDINQDPPQGSAALTPDDVSRMVNQAISSHLSRALPKAIEAALGGVTKAFDDKLLALAKPNEPPQDKPPQVSPELTAMQRKIDDLLTANRASEERALAVERKAREDSAFAELKTELGRYLKSEFTDPIAKSLYYADKRVEFDETGKPLFRALVPQYPGGPMQETLLPLKDGVEAYAKSREAEAYRPPPTPKTPAFPVQRIASSGGGQLPGNGGKIPSVTEDPGWAGRITQELIAAGIPVGGLG